MLFLVASSSGLDAEFGSSRHTFSCLALVPSTDPDPCRFLLRFDVAENTNI